MNLIWKEMLEYSTPRNSLIGGKSKSTLSLSLIASTHSWKKKLFLISDLLNIIVVILKIFLCSYLLCDPRSLHFKQEKHRTRNYDVVFHTKLQWSHPLTINLLVISSWLAWFKVTIISPTFHYHCLFFFFFFILFLWRREWCRATR